MTEDMYLRVGQVVARTGLSRATIYNMMKQGSFPMKTALGVRAVGWLESEIVHWMASRKEVTKTGRESKPGTRKQRQVKSVENELLSSGPEKKKASPYPSSGRPTRASSSLDGWQDDSPAPSQDEMEKLRAKLLASKVKSTSASTKVTRTATSILISPADEQRGILKARSIALKGK
jgi:prophage regulatory protein